MRLKVIACDGCQTILGPESEVDTPELPEVGDLYDSERFEESFADDWLYVAYPNPDDPVAIDVESYCPDCK